MSFDADPLFNERNAFYKGSYQSVITDAADKPEARALILRSKIELDPHSLITELKSSKDDLSRAAYALCLHKTGNVTESYKIAETLTTSTESDVQLIIATIFARDTSGEHLDDAIEILSSMENSLESVALLIQIYLSTNQLSQAQSILTAATKWAQDAELIQLADAWVSLRRGGDGYNSAFYTFQEFADSNGAPARMQVSQAVTEIELGHYDEAESTLDNVLAKDPNHADALANRIALGALRGQDTAEYTEKLRKADTTHPAVTLLKEKTAEFDSLAANYTFVKA